MAMARLQQVPCCAFDELHAIAVDVGHLRLDAAGRLAAGPRGLTECSGANLLAKGGEKAARVTYQDRVSGCGADLVACRAHGMAGSTSNGGASTLAGVSGEPASGWQLKVHATWPSLRQWHWPQPTMEEAVAELTAFAPTILVSDVHMPNLDVGILCRRFRELSQGRAIRIVLISSMTGDELKARLEEIKPDAFVPKMAGAVTVADRVAQLWP